MKIAVIRMEGNAQHGVTRPPPATDAEDGGVRMDLIGMGRMEGTSRKAEHRTQWEGIGVPSGHVDLGASQVGLVVKEPSCQCRRSKRHRFDPWVEKIPWRRAWHPSPLFSSGESMDRGAWRAIVLWVENSRKQLKQLNTAHTAQRRFTWRNLPGNLGQKAAALALLIWVHPPGNG